MVVEVSLLHHLPRNNPRPHRMDFMTTTPQEEQFRSQFAGIRDEVLRQVLIILDDADTLTEAKRMVADFRSMANQLSPAPVHKPENLQ